MPNGHHDFDTTTRPALDAFFAPIEEQTENFAMRHNLRLTKYYHQWEQWDLSFRHPGGGVGKIDMMKESDSMIKIGCNWWIDDYEEGTRSIRGMVFGEFPIEGTDLAVILMPAFQTIIAWEKDQWDKVISGFKDAWQRVPREVFEDLSLYPVPHTTEA